MLKLYKQVGKEMLYWRTWDKDEYTGVIHWGVIGQRGQDKEIKSGLFSNFKKTIQNEIDQKLSEGYAEFKEASYFFLVIKYTIDGFLTDKHLHKRRRLEEKMDLILASTGLGYSDGGSIENGTMVVGCVVVDFNIAKKIIEENLKNTEFSNYSGIFRIKN